MAAVEQTGAPRICSAPDYLSSSWGEAQELLAHAGVKLDGWQEFVLERALGEDEDGNWAAFEVGVNVPRQNGKGEILLARELIGLFLLEEKFQVHSAHQVDTSLEAFRRLLAVIENTPDLDRQVWKVTNTNGREGIELRNGCRIRFRSRSRGGGRGFSGDAVYLDEAMFLPEYAVAALMPSLSARTVTGSVQIWYTGSAVDQFVHEHGIVFARLRARALAGADPSLAWFEWSVDGDSPLDVPEAIATDPSVWAEANPGLGIRISSDHVEKEQRSMDSRSFAVERLGVGDWPSLIDEDTGPITLDSWVALVDEQSELQNPVCLAYDVSPDRRASIAAAGRNQHGRLHIEITDSRSGTDWIVARLAELETRHNPEAIVYAASSPAASLARELEDAGVTLTEISVAGHADACGRLVDLVSEQELAHLGSLEIQNALRGASTRPFGDAWLWSRKSSAVDIAPLVAATLALDAAAGITSGPMRIY